MIGWWSGEDSEGSDIVDTVRNDDVFDTVLLSIFRNCNFWV